MSTEANKEIVQQFFASFNAGNPSALGETLADTFVAHNPFPGQEPDRAGMLGLLSAIVTAFSGSAHHR